MRITEVRATALRNPDADRVDVSRGPRTEPEALAIVEVETDAGLTGIGTVGGFATGAAEIVNRHFAPLLAGADPAHIEAHWERLYAALARSGQRGTGVMALSGVDIALWDLLGKSLGRPVCELLGGKAGQRVPVYASQLRYRNDLDALAAEAARLKERGFGAVKYFFTAGASDGAAGARQELRAVRAVREAIGPDLRLFTDAHFKWDLPFAQRMQEGLAEFDIGWLENPLPLDDLAGYERLAALGGAPLAAGESERTRFPFVRLIDAGVFYLQPDVNRVGGLTETLRICGLAASHNRPVCPHQGWLHTWHLIAARACCPIGEYFPKVERPPGGALIWQVLEGEPEAERGGVEVPDRPGFGWTVNTAAVRRWAIG